MIADLDQLSQKGMTEGWNEDMQKKEKDLWGQLEAREKQEGIYWKQKSKVKWLQEGEKNTKFFHNSVIQDRHSSRIVTLKKMEGGRIETCREIEEELNYYFADILNEDLPDMERDIAQISRLIPPSVTREDNKMLIQPVSLQEVEEAVNQMALGKAPGPDGFTSNFFH